MASRSRSKKPFDTFSGLPVSPPTLRSSAFWSAVRSFGTTICQPEGLTVLSSGGDGDLDRPVQRGHLDVVAERRLHEVHPQLVDGVVIAPRQLGVRLHTQDHVQVAGLAALNAGLALARKPDLGPRVNTGRDAHGELALALDTAVAGARRAW